LFACSLRIEKNGPEGKGLQSNNQRYSQENISGGWLILGWVFALNLDLSSYSLVF